MIRNWRRLAVLTAFTGALWGQGLTISTGSLPQGTAGFNYTSALFATGGTTPYTWSIIAGSLPPGLTLVSLNSAGNISGTPTATGIYSFTVKVTDVLQAQAIRSFSLTIVGPAQFSITTTSLANATQGQSYSQTLAATNGTPPYQWTASQGLPPGLTLSSSGVLSGVPTTLGTFNFQVQATDAAQHTAVGGLSLTVNPAPLAIITVPPLFSGIVGVSYAQSFSASGGRPPYTWSLVSGSVPGLTLDAVSGIFQGTPQTAGTFNFIIQVADSTGSKVSQSFSVTVTQPTLTLIASGQLPGGAVGVPYSQKIPATASGGAPPYSWSVSSGGVPGLDFDPVNIALSGTPTTSGTYSVTVQVRDSAGQSSSRPFQVTIAPAGLTITTGRELADASFNAPFSQQITASGGVPPYSWSANGLPTGLTIDSNSGLISGTPVAAGNFAFAVTVSDSTLNRFSDRFSLNVTLPATPAVTITGLPTTVGAAQQYPIQIALASAFPVAISGQALLSFAPNSGPSDRTVQFASGGTTVAFTVPAGSTSPTFDVPLAVQTGTVSGTISISLRLQAGVTDITPSPAPIASGQLAAAAPVIKAAQFTRGTNSISITVTGFSTSREVTQAVFTFSAASGQTLQSGASSITVPVETLFTTWFQDPANAAYGSQFVFTQTFQIQGDAAAVIPQSVTLTNRIGSANANITQ